MSQIKQHEISKTAVRFILKANTLKATFRKAILFHQTLFLCRLEKVLFFHLKLLKLANKKIKGTLNIRLNTISRSYGLGIETHDENNCEKSNYLPHLIMIFKWRGSDVGVSSKAANVFKEIS